MPYEMLIAALIEEGNAKRAAILRKARDEADRLIVEAHAAAEALEREADLCLRDESAKQRVETLSRAALARRRMLLDAKHEVLDAVWRRATEKALALTGSDRARTLAALLGELLAAAPSGSLKVVIDRRERPHLESYLRERALSFEEQQRDDLALGAEVENGGEILRASFSSRLAKTKPEILVELNRLLFTNKRVTGDE
jgi:vacuolar-type H+-ATPase subunit E/Vma4